LQYVASQKHVRERLLIQRPGPPGGDVPVELGADAGHLALADPGPAERDDQVIDPAGADAFDVGLHHHRVQRDVDAPARGEQRREERPGPHLRNLHRQVAGGRGDRLVAAAVALRRARVAALVGASADVRGRFGIDDGLQHPAEQPAHELTAVGAAKHVDHLEQGRIV
jgi:hypothetical protein